MKKLKKKHFKRAAIGFAIWIVFSLLISDFVVSDMVALIIAGLFGALHYLMAAAGMNPLIRGMKLMWEGDLFKKDEEN